MTKTADRKPGPQPEVAALSRRAAAEGCVLLENAGDILPLKEGTRVAFFGRMQKTYLGSGTGSGGMVVVPYRTNLLDSLRAEPTLTVNETLAAVYADWETEHPFDNGPGGWATEPASQVEMPLTDELVAQAAAESDVALVVLARLAGESKCFAPEKGSFFLREDEEEMLAKVSAHFARFVVLVNAGSVHDMSWVDTYRVPAVLYLWQGGMEGGNAAADVLVGRVNPSGRLPDTIARTLDDYPSTAHFGAEAFNCFCEDVYVGYRWFETFAPDRVRYPFGFGLSYTTFGIETLSVEDAGGQIRLRVAVTNTGAVAGRQVVQAYFGAPQGKLGRPVKELAAFGKTRLLAPGESETLSLAFDIDRMAGYDDSGVTGHPYAYVLEAGDYIVFVGDNVRTAQPVFTYPLAETVVTEQLEQALAPTRPFERVRPVAGEDGFTATYEPVPLRRYDVKDRIAARRPADIPQTGDRGLRLVDVKEGRCTMDEFIAQLSDRDLTAIARGEGMNSPRVSGSGSAFGGVTEPLQLFGIPAVSTSDGPSGLRMQTAEEEATLMPCGNLLAATFDEALNEELFAWEGVEMKAYAVDALLGPGINIHRNPLNGRNFEYFSEDPFLTGVMAAAQCRGMGKSGVTGTIKHFCANSQEINRIHGDSVVSERALREIYLRPFEMAIKEGGAQAVMTAYNAVNGVHASSNYDLNTTILRKEWGFDGVVMSDWWTVFNEEGGPDEGRLRHVMVRAQNDVCMVVVNGSAGDDSQDNIFDALRDGRLTRGELQRNAANICRYAMRVDAMARYAEVDYRPRLRKKDGAVLFSSEDESIRYVDFEAPEDGLVELALTAIVEGDELAQISLFVSVFGTAATRFQLHGTGGQAAVFATEGVVHKGANRFTVGGRPKGVRIVKVEVREI